jgi:hypothetical protein
VKNIPNYVLQNIPNVHKIYQETVKWTKGP